MGRRERERGRESGWIYVHIAMRIFTDSRNYPSRVFFQRGYYGNRSYSWIKGKIERCGTRDEDTEDGEERRG